MVAHSIPTTAGRQCCSGPFPGAVRLGDSWRGCPAKLARKGEACKLLVYKHFLFPLVAGAVSGLFSVGTCHLTGLSLWKLPWPTAGWGRGMCPSWPLKTSRPPDTALSCEPRPTKPPHFSGQTPLLAPGALVGEVGGHLRTGPEDPLSPSPQPHCPAWLWQGHPCGWT